MEFLGGFSKTAKTKFPNIGPYVTSSLLLKRQIALISMTKIETRQLIASLSS